MQSRDNNVISVMEAKEGGCPHAECPTCRGNSWLRTACEHRWAVPLLTGMLVLLSLFVCAQAMARMESINRENCRSQRCRDENPKMGFFAGVLTFAILGLILNPPQNALKKCCILAFALSLYREVILAVFVYGCFRAAMPIHTVVARAFCTARRRSDHHVVCITGTEKCACPARSDIIEEMCLPCSQRQYCFTYPRK
jgi:hypothetical protein